MRINDVLGRLKGVKRNGNQYAALCPAHDDKKPSLAVSEKDGKILLHCHAGCPKENIMAAIGLEMKDLFIGESPDYTSGSGKPKREVAAVYDYRDLDGNIVHSTIRYNPKGFSQRRPDPDRPAEHIYKDVFKDITPILYNLQAVTSAIKDKQPVVVVEGEKDCDTLAGLGYAATTCPMGAGKWRRHYSDTLKGGTVYIIADRDGAGINHANFVAKSLAGKAEAVYMIDLATAAPGTAAELPGGFDVSDLMEMTPSEKRKAAVADLIAHAAQYRADDGDGNDGGANGKKNPAEQLLTLVESSGAKFFHNEVKDLYATIHVDNHIEVLLINSRDFELWLNGLFYRNTSKPISKDSVKQVLAVLSSKALFENPDPIKLSTRVAESDGAFWYDLSNKNWQTVKIGKDGWEVSDNPPILFSRYRHQLEQVLPKSGGDINKILNYVNIKNGKTLFLCWLVSCFIPNIPHAVIIIHGEKGAAKSTASCLLKSLIDPSALDTLTLQNDQRTMAVNLQNHWFLPFDNVSFINEETSDTLCRAVTGGGIQQRKLHTNAEDAIFTFQRCVAINGIHNVATRADLLDRSILIELVRITDSDRKELSEVLANFEADKADMLGGVFDTVVKAMRIYPSVKLQNLPRMADFARWGYAIGEALGAGMGQIFLAEYTGNRQIQNEEAIANDPVATLIVEFMKDRQEWTGLYSTLYKLLADMAEENGISPKHKSFPANAIALSKRITAIKSNLENVGINCVPEKRNKHGQGISIKRPNSSTSSAPSALTAENGASRGVDSGADRKGANSSTPAPTSPSTPEKARSYRAGADNVVGVDKIDPLADSCSSKEVRHA
jgi:5S rRNA maturation endonuclease (ribonuclease M5)